MDIDGGGWIFVWSYIFIDYENFWMWFNVVIFRFRWLNIVFDLDVFVFIILLLNEIDYNVMDFLLWK